MLWVDIFRGEFTWWPSLLAVEKFTIDWPMNLWMFSTDGRNVVPPAVVFLLDLSSSTMMDPMLSLFDSIKLLL